MNQRSCNKRQRFSIRKYHFGAASVLVGALLFLGQGTVSASENTGSSVDLAPGNLSPATVSVDPDNNGSSAVAENTASSVELAPGNLSPATVSVDPDNNGSSAVAEETGDFAGNASAPNSDGLVSAVRDSERHDATTPDSIYAMRSAPDIETRSAEERAADVGSGPSESEASEFASNSVSDPNELVEEHDYYYAASWERTSDIVEMETKEQRYYYKDQAHKEAVGTIIGSHGKEIKVTAKIESTNGTDEDGSYFFNGGDMSNNAGPGDSYAGLEEAKDIPGLGVILYSPRPEVIGLKDNDYVNFDGDVELATITFTFSEEVTNPIMDFSGIGGFAAISQDYAVYNDVNDPQKGATWNSYWRGSYMATKFEVVTQGITLNRVTEGKNIIINSEGMMEVAKKNTNNSGTEANIQGIASVPSGTGTVQLTGTFSKVVLRLYGQFTPMSYFIEDDLNAKKYKNDGGVADGINGWNYIGKSNSGVTLGNDKEHIEVPIVPTGAGNKIFKNDLADKDTFHLANKVPNTDAFRISMRILPQGDVEVHYHIVDKDGNVILENAIEKRDVKVDANIDEDYSTIPEREEVITVDGKEYRLVIDGANPHPYTDGDDEEGKVEEQDGPKIINYYYEAVPATGSFQEHHIYITKDQDGVEVSREVVDGATSEGRREESYQTGKVEKDGFTFVRTEQPVNDPTYNEDGTPAEGNYVPSTKQEITYVYEKVVSDLTPNKPSTPPTVTPNKPNAFFSSSKSETTPTVLSTSKPNLDSQQLPRTGDGNGVVLSSLGALLALIGLGLGSKKRRKED